MLHTVNSNDVKREAIPLICVIWTEEEVERSFNCDVKRTHVGFTAERQSVVCKSNLKWRYWSWILYMQDQLKNCLITMGVRKAGQGGQLPPPWFWVKVYLGEHFFSTAASCNRIRLFYRPYSSKFPNFSRAGARTLSKTVFVADALEKRSIFLPFHSFYMYNALIHAVKLTL